jgi:RNA polymerase sigma factor (sigma-70 family)
MYEIVEDNIKLVYKLCYKYNNYSYLFDSYEDMVQSVVVHLLTKSDKYNPEYKVSTFFNLVIKNYLMSEKRNKERKKKGTVEIPIECIENKAYHIEEPSDLDSYNLHLYTKEYIINELSYKDIAQKYGKSSRTIYKKVQEDFKRIKDTYIY